MRKVMKRTAFAVSTLALLLVFCLPLATSAKDTDKDVTVANNRMIPDVIEEPFKKAVDEGSEALGELGNTENGTVGDNESNGMLGSETDREESSSTDRESGTDGLGITNPMDDEESSAGKTIAIILGIVVLAIIVILIFVAIPKSKAKPGGTDNRR